MWKPATDLENLFVTNSTLSRPIQRYEQTEIDHLERDVKKEIWSIDSRIFIDCILFSI